MVLTRLLRARWDDHTERGRRLLVTGTTYAGHELKAVLYPAEEGDDTWWLATAMYN